MNAPFRLRPAAERDLLRIGRWYHGEGGKSLAERFTFAARDAFVALADTPGLGPSADAKAVTLADARRWRIDGFPHHRIFYVPHREGGVTILRILHTAQDWKQR